MTVGPLVLPPEMELRYHTYNDHLFYSRHWPVCLKPATVGRSVMAYAVILQLGQFPSCCLVPDRHAGRMGQSYRLLLTGLTPWESSLHRRRHCSAVPSPFSWPSLNRVSRRDIDGQYSALYSERKAFPVRREIVRLVKFNSTRSQQKGESEGSYQVACHMLFKKSPVSVIQAICAHSHAAQLSLCEVDQWRTYRATTIDTSCGHAGQD